MANQKHIYPESNLFRENEMTRHALSNAEWAAIKDIACYKPPRGTEPAPETIRPFLDGILWILYTGAPWRDLPDGFGPWQSVYGRFRAYIKHGIFDEILSGLQRDALEEGELELCVVNVDGTYIRAHRHAAGARQKKQETRKPMQKRVPKNRLSVVPGEDSPPKST
jgi:transposase